MNIFEFVPEGAQDCTVRAYLQTGWQLEEMKDLPDLPAVLICPGGGYSMVSEREAEPVAKEFLAANYHVFILYYSVGEKASGFQPLLQLASAMAHIRRHAKQWHVDPNHIAVGGFSAGGHLAASLGTLYNDEKFQKVWEKSPAFCWDGVSCSIRPDAMILSYPVITADEFAHKGSILNVSGAEEGSEEYRYFSLDAHVDPDTPTAFLWHTAEDTCVPVENSLRFAAALSAAKVPFELHILPEGYHGTSICTKEVGSDMPYNRRWVGWCLQWLDKVFSV